MVFLALLLAVAFVTGSLALLPEGEAQAQPMGLATQLTFINRSTAISSSYTTTAVSVADYTTLDSQYYIDQGTTPNTTTIKMQYSINGYDWVDKVTGWGQTDTDGATAITTTTDLGGYIRWIITLSNTETITPSIVGLAK